MTNLDKLIAETKEQIEMLRVDISVMPRSLTKILRQDLRMVKDYLNRLQEKKKKSKRTS